MDDGEREVSPPKRGVKKPTTTNGNGHSVNRWAYPLAGSVIIALLGLVIYVTLKTGRIPIEVALPLLAGASAAAWGYRLSDWKGK